MIHNGQLGPAEHVLQQEIDRLQVRLAELQTRLKEPEEIVRAIRYGEVDAFVVNETPEERIYTLRSADVLYRLMIEDMKEGAAALDASGIILYCNWHFASLLKAKRDAMLGASIFPYIPEASRSFFDMLRQEPATGTGRTEASLRAGDGSLIPVLLTMNRIALDEQTVFCMIATDLSEQKRQEELITASQRKDVFLAMLAHELRNPIAPIRNAAHVLRLADVSQADIHWAVEVIERQVVQLARLVDDLLDVSRIGSGKIGLQMETVDLRGVIGAAVEAVRPLIDARKHELSIELPTAPLLLKGDSARLTQIVANLLSNAAKFTPSKGRIWIVAQRQQDEALVRVRDTGVGIPAEMLPKVFDLFTQVDPSPNRSQDGLGIGLTLVKSLAELHGGRVSVTSAGPGAGSEFMLRLPLLPAGAEGQAKLRPQAEKRPSTSRCRILVVDDNRDAAESLAMLIQQWEHEARVALTGEAAIEEAKTLRPHVVILDIGMPGTNGYEVARQLRQLPGMQEAILVALTGYGREEDRLRSREAGFNHHWLKPAPIEAIEELLSSING